MKYRVTTNGNLFKVQWRPKYWPFWSDASKEHYALGTMPALYLTLDDANNYIYNLICDDNLAEATWKAVR